MRWHLVGHLQSNKSKQAIELFDFIETLDSAKLALRLDSAAEAAGKRVESLIEVKLPMEYSRGGLRSIVEKSNFEMKELSRHQLSFLNIILYIETLE